MEQLISLLTIVQIILHKIDTYTTAGNVTAKLTVDDGIAAPVIQTINFTVAAPLASLSTDVSVSGPARCR